MAQESSSRPAVDIDDRSAVERTGASISRGLSTGSQQPVAHQQTAKVVVCALLQPIFGLAQMQCRLKRWMQVVVVVVAVVGKCAERETKKN